MLETIISSGGPQLLAAIGGLIFTFFKSFKFVQEGELGLKLRFGKVVRNRDGAPRVIQPGFAILIPWVDSLVRRHVRQQEVTLEEQTITLESGLTFQVAGAVYFRVHDVYKALFEISKLDESIEQLSMGMLRDEVASHKDHHDLSDAEAVAKKIFDKIREKTDTWGVKLIDFRITTAAPTSESATIVNLEAASSMRVKVLHSTSELMGVPLSSLIDSGFAAIIVGAPLVASSAVTNNSTTQVIPKKED